jgi:hypothetical protein
MHLWRFGGKAPRVPGVTSGIEANPDKIWAIEAMRPPARLMDMQMLTGSLAALSRFISRLAERALPFLKLMRGPVHSHGLKRQNKPSRR